jgi:DNA-binding CsgD family transcriptional regulator
VTQKIYPKKSPIPVWSLTAFHDGFTIDWYDQVRTARLHEEYFMVPNPVNVTLTSEERNLLYLAVTGHSPAQSALAMDLPLPRALEVMDELQERFGVSSRNALIVHAIVRRWI